MSNATASPNDKPVIHAFWVGQDRTVVEINWIHVPPGQRGQGVGRRTYEEWEKALPPTVELVTLFAADSDGSGNSDPFWERLGFGWQFNANDASDIPYESLHRMHKGVNGYPTPKSVWWENEDDNALDDEPDDDEEPAARVSALRS